MKYIKMRNRDIVSCMSIRFKTKNLHLLSYDDRSDLIDTLIKLSKKTIDEIQRISTGKNYFPL